MRCPNCGRDAETGDLFCAGCGHELERRCPGCGRVNLPDARFCASCGVELAGAAPTTGAATSTGAAPEVVAAPVAFGDAGPSSSDLEGTEDEDDPGPPLWEPLLTPASGVPAWREPDGSGPVVAELPGDVEVLVLERRDAWARVSVESGWSGWVDGRRLVDPDLVETPGAKERTP